MQTQFLVVVLLQLTYFIICDVCVVQHGDTIYDVRSLTKPNGGVYNIVQNDVVYHLNVCDGYVDVDNTASPHNCGLLFTASRLFKTSREFCWALVDTNPMKLQVISEGDLLLSQTTQAFQFHINLKCSATPSPFRYIVQSNYNLRLFEINTPLACGYPVPKCFGIKSTNATVCSGHGVCTSTDACECETGYSGTYCNEVICSGVTSKDSIVCSGVGHCIAPDICECDSRYSGKFCQLPSCFKIPTNNTAVCSGHGSCVALDICKCAAGYVGEDCSIPECSLIPANQSNVCHGSGRCVDVDTCKCVSGYEGTDCQYAVCHGVSTKYVGSVCSGNGFCRAPDTCECNERYTGMACQILKDNKDTQTHPYKIPFYLVTVLTILTLMGCFIVTMTSLMIYRGKQAHAPTANDTELLNEREDNIN